MVFVQPCTQIVASIVACVTSALSTPGVRTASAWYGDSCGALCGQAIATPRRSSATATSAVRIDMRMKVRARACQRKLCKLDMAHGVDVYRPVVKADGTT
jgi:hypothetical protein